MSPVKPVAAAIKPIVTTERGAPAHPVAIGAEHDRADRAHQERRAERREGAEHRSVRIKGAADRDREIAVDREVEELEEIADGAGQDRAPADRGEAGKVGAG
jgi:hypothetical protein